MNGSLILLVACAVALAGLARRIGVSAPLLLVIAGLAATFVPGVPSFALDPELVLPFVLPPLLYKEAVDSSYLNLRASMRPVALLSVGYVLFSTLLVGWVVHLVIPGMPASAALCLGAVLAPTDAVAASGIARSVGLPGRFVTLLQGESLFNDATAITLVRVAVAAAVGSGFSLLSGVGEFLLASVGGVAVGLVLGVVVQWLRVRLRDPRLRTVLSLLIPFAAYELAESFEASGVLAVVVLGVYLGHRSATVDYAARLIEGSVWKMLDFVLEAVVFALIGLQLPVVVSGLGRWSAGQLAGYSALVLAVLIVGRFVWMFPGAWLPRLMFRYIREREPSPGWQGPVIMAWAGMRGVVSLAVAFSIPLRTEDGSPFPGRELILFLVFVAVIGTLVLQGFTLPKVISWMRLPKEDPQQATLAEASAQEEASRVAQARLEELLAEPGNQLPEALEERLRVVLTRRRNAVWERMGAVNAETGESQDETYRRLARIMIETERAEFVRLRNERRIEDELLRRLLRRLDHEEAAVAG
ncbi:Na+/H+ antiporter [Mangrovactinospora gilvigrisea]|uniref:Na+/H+ antiporter n=1 Tax=Mangrovactinospora gilvigrisea TaxID=1428644 RepID=UPI000AA165F5|nr:Na+/H+ antiporter [Mangrovactinospora gilvigrisea]